MKSPQFPALILFVSALAPVLSAHAVVGGRAVTAADSAALQPVLRLGFDRAPCTGTYLGGGLILTAYHCIAIPRNDHEDRPDLCIFGADGGSLGCVFSYGYATSAPHTDVFARVPNFEGTDIPIPQPDIVLLKVPRGHLRTRLESLHPMPVSFDRLDTPSTADTRIAGQGCDSYQPGFFHGDGVGTLRTGSVRVLGAAELTYFMRWAPEGTSAGACNGDSGGPLYSVDSGGKLLQYGVADKIVKLQEPHHLSVISHYTRLDQPLVRDWLEGELTAEGVRP